jgi:hypothetical protein
MLGFGHVRQGASFLQPSSPVSDLFTALRSVLYDHLNRFELTSSSIGDGFQQKLITVTP